METDAEVVPLQGHRNPCVPTVALVLSLTQPQGRAALFRMSGLRYTAPSHSSPYELGYFGRAFWMQDLVNSVRYQTRAMENY